MQESLPIDLKEFQLTYDIAEDRLKFVIASGDDQTSCLWLTRRLIQKIWPALINVLQPYIQQSFDDVLHEIGENQLSQSHIEKRFQYQASETPQLIIYGAEESYLVVKVEVTVEESQLMAVKLVDVHEQGVKMSLSAELLLTLCKIISQAIETSEWNLDLQHRHLISDASPEDLETEAQPVKIKQSTRLN